MLKSSSKKRSGLVKTDSLLSKKISIKTEPVWCHWKNKITAWILQPNTLWELWSANNFWKLHLSNGICSDLLVWKSLCCHSFQITNVRLEWGLIIAIQCFQKLTAFPFNTLCGVFFSCNCFLTWMSKRFHYKIEVVIFSKCICFITASTLKHIPCFHDSFIKVKYKKASLKVLLGVHESALSLLLSVRFHEAHKKLCLNSGKCVYKQCC